MYVLKYVLRLFTLHLGLSPSAQKLTARRYWKVMKDQGYACLCVCDIMLFFLAVFS